MKLQDLNTVLLVTVEQVPKPGRGGPGAVISIEKARKLLKWEPRTTLTEGLQKYIEWIKKKF